MATLPVPASSYSVPDAFAFTLDASVISTSVDAYVRSLERLTDNHKYVYVKVRTRISRSGRLSYRAAIHGTWRRDAAIFLLQPHLPPGGVSSLTSTGRFVARRPAGDNPEEAIEKQLRTLYNSFGGTLPSRHHSLWTSLIAFGASYGAVPWALLVYMLHAAAVRAPARWRDLRD